MIGALAPLIDAGRVKVYCVDGADAWSWRADDVPLEERARRHGDYERWITDDVAPFIHDDTAAARSSRPARASAPTTPRTSR